MNLRSQVLLSGLCLLFVQIGALIAFFYFWVSPQVDQLEKTMVEKDLHRGLAVLQRELFHLGYLADLLSELPLIQNLIASPFPQNPAANKFLEEKMLMLGINILDVLSKDHKVIWEKMLDLNTGQAYFHQTFLPRLWEERPSFLMPASVLNTEAGIYNSQWGPLLIVSAPIFLNDKKAQGALIVGRLITSEVIQLIQSLTFAKTVIFPVEEDEALAHKQEAILESLLQRDAYTLIEPSGALLQGYTVLMDVNDKPDLLISTTQPRDVMTMIRLRALEVMGGLIFFFFLFLGTVLFLIRRKVTRPLLSCLSQLKQKNEGPFLETSGEMNLLFQAFTHFIAFQKSNSAQAATLAYQKGTQEAYQSIIKNIQEIRHFVLAETASMEKYLFSLPLNEVEWLLAQRRIQASSQEETEKWQQVSDALRLFQKEMRYQLQALQTHILRMMSRTSEEARKPLSHALKKKAHTPYY